MFGVANERCVYGGQHYLRTMRLAYTTKNTESLSRYACSVCMLYMCHYYHHYSRPIYRGVADGDLAECCADICGVEDAMMQGMGEMECAIKNFFKKNWVKYLVGMKKYIYLCSEYDVKRSS